MIIRRFQNTEALLRTMMKRPLRSIDSLPLLLSDLLYYCPDHSWHNRTDFVTALSCSAPPESQQRRAAPADFLPQRALQRSAGRKQSSGAEPLSLGAPTLAERRAPPPPPALRASRRLRRLRHAFVPYRRPHDFTASHSFKELHQPIFAIFLRSHSWNRR